MSFNDPAIAQYLDGEFIRHCDLFEVQLASGTMFLALQDLPFTDNNGQEWQRANSDVVSFSDVAVTTDGSAQKRSFTLSLANSTLGNQLANSESEYRGRKIIQYKQLFAPDWTPVSTPQFLNVSFMDTVTSTMSATGQAQVVIDCEGIFSNKSSSENGVLTQADQKKRYPDDDGLNWAKRLQEGFDLEWPN